MVSLPRKEMQSRCQARPGLRLAVISHSATSTCVATAVFLGVLGQDSVLHIGNVPLQRGNAAGRLLSMAVKKHLKSTCIFPPVTESCGSVREQLFTNRLGTGPFFG